MLSIRFLAVLTFLLQVAVILAYDCRPGLKDPEPWPKWERGEKVKLRWTKPPPVCKYGTGTIEIKNGSGLVHFFPSDTEVFHWIDGEAEVTVPKNLALGQYHLTDIVNTIGPFEIVDKK